MRRNKGYEVFELRVIKDYREGEMVIKISRNGSFYDEAIFHMRDDKAEAFRYLVKLAARMVK